MSQSPPRSRLRRRVWCLIAGFALLLGLDLSRVPERQWTTRSLLTWIDLYQATLSPLMPVAGVRCRFTPTCSHYGEGVIRRHGAFWGSRKAAWRVLRCGPWTEAGTPDPPS